jgi:hypothetical protein
VTPTLDCRLWLASGQQGSEVWDILIRGGKDCDRKSALLKRSFSTVWTATIARKDAFCSISQNLHKIPPECEKFRRLVHHFSFRDDASKKSEIFKNFAKILIF